MVIITGLYSCKESINDNPNSNQPPTTKIFLQPDSSVSQQQSKIKICWSGDDPDGLVIGFYFSWDDIHWTFTTNNDSLFSLQIGAVDTSFSFKVSAVDNGGNGVYDSLIMQNGIHFGAEPFKDYNQNNKYDSGEPFTDIGLIDQNPAALQLPIKNTAPTIKWNALSTHPDTSFSVMSFGWDASDIDGNSTISKINIALNDSSNFISVNGAIRRITIRTNDFASSSPLMEILIDGDPNNQPYNLETGQLIKLPGLLFNSNNIFYVQAVDISGAKSPWLKSYEQPAPSKTGWYVKKPKGKFIIIDDYKINDNAPEFYSRMMDSLQLRNKYDVYDIAKHKLPYLNTTFLETIKLFSCTIWYGNESHSADLANAVVQRYTDNGGKLLFSLQFPQNIDLNQIQGYLPILINDSYYVDELLPGVTLSDTSHYGYPMLETTESVARVRAFNLGPFGVKGIYYFTNHEVSGCMGFENTDKNKFFIGIPLHLANGIPGSVKELLNKVLFQDFNLTR